MRVHFALNFISTVLLTISISSLFVIIYCLNSNLNFLPFLFLFILSLFLSGAIYISTKDIEIKFDIKTSIYSIFLSWVTLILMGSLPLFFICTDAKFLDVLFISTALSTTTGSWFYDNIIISNELLIWQSTLQWLGGLLTIVLATSFVEAMFDRTNVDKKNFDLPKLKTIFLIYSLLTLCFFGLFYYFNLSLEESFRLSVSIISTSASINSSDSVFAFYDNKILLVMIFGMLLGSLSISLHYKAFVNGISSYYKDYNVKIIILLSIFSYAVFSYFSELKHFDNMLINKLFIFFSMISTTGFIPYVENYTEYFSPLVFFFVFLALVGGASYSTTGGIKITRLIYMFRYIGTELHHLAHPREILSSNKKFNTENTSLIFLSTIVLFFLIFFFTTLFTSLDIEFERAFLIVITFITNTGVGILEIANINYYPSSVLEYIISIVLMIIGRIETILFMLIFSRIFWLES